MCLRPPPSCAQSRRGDTGERDDPKQLPLVWNINRSLATSLATSRLEETSTSGKSLQFSISLTLQRNKHRRRFSVCFLSEYRACQSIG